MKNLRIATVQFEHTSGRKKENLDRMEELARRASNDGADIVSFHECCISGYTFATRLSRDELTGVAEPIPEGPSLKRLIRMAGSLDLTLLAGLYEMDGDGRFYNSYVCVNGDGLIARHRKLHPFIHPDLSPGDAYTVFSVNGWRCGILICYDNNIPENVRATHLLGADILFMPHVTMCTPSTRPGAGFVDPELWKRREEDPTTLREEFDGLKGRSWLMKWLPSRAYDNACYAVFSNPIGMDDDQLKNGCSMILDPYGDIVAECRRLGDDVATALITPDKLTRAGGYRYLQARRPDLYREILTREHEPQHTVSWLHDNSGPDQEP